MYYNYVSIHFILRLLFLQFVEIKIINVIALYFLVAYIEQNSFMRSSYWIPMNHRFRIPTKGLMCNGLELGRLDTIIV